MNIREQKRPERIDDRGADHQETALMIRRCEGCRQLMPRPALACLQCHSHDFERVRSSGGGRVISWRIHQQAVKGKARTEPIILAIVELDDGPWIYAAIESEITEMPAGRIRVEFRSASTTSDFPVFAPAILPEPVVPWSGYR